MRRNRIIRARLEIYHVSTSTGERGTPGSRDMLHSSAQSADVPPSFRRARRADSSLFLFLFIYFFIYFCMEYAKVRMFNAPS